MSQAPQFRVRTRRVCEPNGSRAPHPSWPTMRWGWCVCCALGHSQPQSITPFLLWLEIDRVQGPFAWQRGRGFPEWRPTRKTSLSRNGPYMAIFLCVSAKSPLLSAQETPPTRAEVRTCEIKEVKLGVWEATPEAFARGPPPLPVLRRSRGRRFRRAAEAPELLASKLRDRR